jgi:hypothetical protein
LSASFEALLNAIETLKTPVFTAKLTEYTGSLRASIIKMEAQTPPDFELGRARELLAKTERLLNNISQNQK